MVTITQSRWVRLFKLPLLFLIFLLILHVVMLSITRFENWPEMILYPWFLTKNLTYYRDIILMYPPGAYFMLFPVYALLGFTPGTERIAAIMIALIGDVTLFVVSYKIFGKAIITAAVTSFYVFWHVLFGGNTLWYEPLLIPLYTAGFYEMYRYLRTGSRYALLYSGILIALGTLIKQTTLFMLAISVFFVLYYGWKNIRQALRNAVILITPVALVSALAIVTATAFGVGSEYLYWVYRFPLTVNLPQSAYMLLPTLSDIVYMFPAYTPVIVLLIMYLNVPRKKRGPEVPFIMALTAGLFVAGATRFGMHKVLPTLPFAALSAGFAAKYYSAGRPMNIPVLSIIALISVFIFVGQFRSMWKFVSVRNNNTNEFFGSRYTDLGRYISEKIGDKPYFVFGDYDYVYMYGNDRPGVIPWSPMFPWNWQSEGIQDRIIASLEAQQIQYILYVPYHPDKPLYDNKMPEKLYSYIYANYTHVGTLPGGGSLLRRNSIALAVQ